MCYVLYEFPCIHNCAYIEKTLDKVPHHWNHLTIICYDKTCRKSLQWFSWKEAIISPSLQERVCFTDYMKRKGDKQRICLIQNNNNNNNNKKNSILPSGGNRWMSSSTDRTFTRFLAYYTWWEIRNQHINRYLQWPCHHPYVVSHEEKHPEGSALLKVTISNVGRCR